MRILTSVIAACLVTGVMCMAAHGESLVVTDSVFISEQNADFAFGDTTGFQIGGVYMTDSTIYAACNLGIVACLRAENQWHMIAGREEYVAAWGDGISEVQKENGKFHPSRIWKMPSGELGIYDDWVCRFYSVVPGAPPTKRLRLIKSPDENSIIESTNAQDNMLLCGLYSIHHDRMVDLANPDLSGYRRIFAIPPQLRHDLDSMGADYYPEAAFNPSDSTIWVAFRHYNMIYIINPKGDVLDSVSIDDPHFVLPRPPVSRIKSTAVYHDWISKCASVYSLQFVPPMYFLLQFFGPGKWTEDGANRPLHLLFWNGHGESVDIKVNPEWKITQVQSDGCLPFVAYERKERVVTKATIYLARIAP